MKAKALSPELLYKMDAYRQHNITFRFVSNIHGSDFTEATGDLDAEDTLKMERSLLISHQMPAPLKSSSLAVNRTKWRRNASTDRSGDAKRFMNTPLGG